MVTTSQSGPTDGGHPRQLAAQSKRPPPPIPSPRDSLLPYLTSAETERLAYPPDMLPGARDVSTPHGTMRVNEWGPEDGRRVLFVHGDATPSPLWMRVAWGLTKRGCRVMTYDLWGRGYTDAPYPNPIDSTILKNQVLYAICSSPVSWTTGIPMNTTGAGDATAAKAALAAPPGFSLVGFSLGGSVGVDFAGDFPQLVNSLALLAPAGLLRSLPADYETIATAEEELEPTDPRMRELVGRILETQTEAAPEHAKKVAAKQQVEKMDGNGSVEAKDWRTWTPNWSRADEKGDDREGKAFFAGLLQFQFDYHEGHIRSVYSTARHGPTHGMQHAYSKLGEHLAGRTGKTYAGRPNLLDRARVLTLLGDADPIMRKDEMREDIVKYLPEDKVDFVTMPGGHGFLWQNSEAIVELLAEKWGLHKSLG